MRIRDVSVPLFLSLFPAISKAVTDPTFANQLSTHRTIASRDVTNSDTALSDRDGLVAPRNSPKGALDVPVDGQDGRPHAGPWVETSAERDRKKSGTGDASDGKAGIQASPSALGRLGTDGMPLPDSNDGVMDDPNRPGPKEGTRGTEGGVSEKQKEHRLSGENVPDGPKEAPPLPHSEQRRLPADDRTGGKEGKAPESASYLGVLEVTTGSLSIR